MDRMFDKNYYKDYPITADFAENRNIIYAKYRKGNENLYHEGIDQSSDKMTKTTIFDNFSGVIDEIGFNEDYGYFVKIKHNAKFVNGADDIFYSKYCHLSYINEKLKKDNFIVYGTVIGKMGNTGHSMGVHLHWQTWQESNSETDLLKDLKLKLNLTDFTQNYFYQWDKLFINPRVIMSYFTKLQIE